VIDGKALPEIYLSHITKWNDPALKALNPKVALSDMAIAVVHRSDSSGTSGTPAGWNCRYRAVRQTPQTKGMTSIGPVDYESSR
jgi:hypothetical protein